MGELSGEVALLRQAQELGAKATENAIALVGKSVDGLTTEVRAIRDQLSEPTASPAGRALQRQIDSHELSIADHEGKLEDFEAFRSEVRGAIKTMRGVVVVVSGISAIISILAAIVAFAQHAPA